jgi:hypothetical protein
LERRSEPPLPPPDPAEEILKECPELGAFSVEGVKNMGDFERGWLKWPRLCADIRG